MDKQLIIVESPTKAKTISRFLGNKYQVMSSYGHIRDLPKGKMGIDIENGFIPEYITPRDKMKKATALKKAAAKINEILFATDEDREGEAIAWHLTHLLDIEPDKTRRIVFHEITKEAIDEALKNPRPLNLKLVNAQQARRILDRLVGYKLSPFLWKKVARGLSAGRVQSVAVRLTAEREREIEAFVSQEYWTVEAALKKGSDEFTAHLVKIKDKTLGKFDLPNEKEANKITADLKKSSFIISDVTSKDVNKNPYPPFTTSSLQQAANRLLGYSAKRTMVVAQQLYEGIKIGSQGESGLITYMRTDSLNLADKFKQQTAQYLKNEFGEKYSQPRSYKTKSKGAQEAHEAIRPTTVDNHPLAIKKHLNDSQFKIYQLIWNRAVASQMPPARLKQTTIDITAEQYGLRATGSVLVFPGWLKIYPDKTQDNLLPELKKQEKLQLLKIIPEQHFTQPPARYSEAGLIKALEEKGIGRPSTYAPTIATILNRNYVELENKRLKPTEIGLVVNDLLIEHFPQIVDYDFTAEMEKELDEIAEGEREWQPVIKDFYQPFAKKLEEKEATLSKQDIMPQRELGTDPKSGKPVSVRVGRFGPFVQLGTKDDDTKPKFASLQPGQTVASLTLPQALKLLTLPRAVYTDEDGNQIYTNIGRFGPYLKIKNTFVSIKDEDPYTIDEKTAKNYIAEHQEKMKKKIIKEFPDSDIKILNGRWGAYITNGQINARLPKEEKGEKLTLDQCQEILDKAPSKKKRQKKS